MEYESDDDTNCNWRARTVLNRLERERQKLEIEGRIETIEKSTKDPRRITVTQTLIKDHQLTLV